MDFTEIYQTTGLVAFSSGAQWVLNAVHDRLIVRRADHFQITRTWPVDTSPSATVASFDKSYLELISNLSLKAIFACERGPYVLGECANLGWGRDGGGLLL